MWPDYGGQTSGRNAIMEIGEEYLDIISNIDSTGCCTSSLGLGPAELGRRSGGYGCENELR